jgi:hypothetical protein
VEHEIIAEHKGIKVSYVGLRVNGARLCLDLCM